MDDFRTPADLSRELGVNQRIIRAYLRKQHGTLVPPETRWLLDNERTDDVLSHFRTSSL